MSDNIYIHVPNITNFDVKYYISESPVTQKKRVFPMHIDDQLEIYVLLEGDVSFVVESSVYRLSPGDAIITKPNERHHCILNSDSTHKHMCLWFEPSVDFIFSDFLAHKFGENNLVSPKEDAKKKLRELYDELKDATDDADLNRQFYLMLEILSIFRKSLSVNTASQSIPPMLEAILSDIDRNFVNISSLDYLRNKYYVSASTLNRMFKVNLRTTPKMYLETKKLAHSRVLLKKGKSVLSACMESGFTDCSNYIRLFKRRFGMTPGQYRANLPSTPNSYK